MSNTYFRFKQFSVEQDRCAMKVSTDACIQGAWTPVPARAKTVLDIGCGTGLLSLMLAQGSPQLHIDAIELDEAAAQQAKENIAASPWAARINLLQGDARIYPFDKKYDFIICNPPFFNNSLLGPGRERNHARHTLSLGYEDLFEILKNNLGPSGCASVLLPAAEHLTWEELLVSKGWQVVHRLLICPRTGNAHNRVVSICAPATAAITAGTETLSIRNGDNSYTAAFTELLQPFYLYL